MTTHSQHRTAHVLHILLTLFATLSIAVPQHLSGSPLPSISTTHPFSKRAVVRLSPSQPNNQLN